MDYLYINAIVKEAYRDLPCSCPFPDSYKGPVLAASAGDAFLKEPSVSGVISFYSIKAKNHVPVLVLSNVQKHTNSASVGRFTQCLGWEWDGRLALQDLDSVFQAAFYSEEEINDLALRNSTVPLPRSVRREPVPMGLTISNKAKQAVLTAVMLRWLRHLPAVRIAVPKGADYNQYVLSAVKELYSIFPVALRAEAGFCSYLPSLKDTNSRIHIGFIPESMADASTIFLDGSSRAAISNICADGTGRLALDNVISYLSNTSPEQRKDFLAALFTDVEHSGDGNLINSITPRDYIPTGECLDLLAMDGTMDQVLPRWKTFCGNLEKYPIQMRQQVQEKIRGSILPEEVCRLFRSRLTEVTTLEAVLDELQTFVPLCEYSQSLPDLLWNATVEHLRRLGISLPDIRNAVIRRKDTLSPLVDDRKTDHLQVRYISEQQEVVKSLPTGTLPEVDQALARIKDLHAMINGLPTGNASQTLKDRNREMHTRLVSIRNELIFAELNKQYQDVLQLPSQTSEQLTQLLDQARKLLISLEKAQTVPGIPELTGNLNALISEKQSVLDSSDVRFRQMMQKLSNSNTYFDMLEVVNADREIELDSYQKEQLARTLADRKPISIADYEEAFRGRYQKKLTLRAVSKLPDYVCSSIVRDICELNKVVVSPRKDSKGRIEPVDQLSERITGHRYIAQRISENCGVEVFFNNNFRNGEWFQKLLTLSHNKDSMGNRSEFEADFYALVDYGFFSGGDMCNCVTMLQNCSMKLTPLFQRMLLGKFRDCNPQQYLDAFRLIKDNSPKKRILEDMQRIVDEIQEKDSTAAKAWRNFVRQQQSSSKKKWVFVIAGGVLLLVIAAIALLLLLGISNKPEPTEAPTKPTIQETKPTEPPKEEYPAEFHKFAESQPALKRLFPDAKVKDFSVLKDSVSKLLTQADEATKTTIAQYYQAGMRDPELDDLDWDAFFFWKCWILANTESPDLSAAFTDAEADLNQANHEAVAITRFLQTYAPVEAPQPSEPVSDPGEESVSQAQQVTDAAQTVSSSTGTVAEQTATAEPTETTAPPLPTVEEILTACSDAAMTPYVEATAGMEDLLKLVELFGAELNKPFSEQASRLDQLLLSSEANATQLRLHYQTLPGDSVIRFADGEIAVTWNEYVFWQFWVLARQEVPVISSDSFNDELNAQVLDILTVLHTLPDVDTHSAAQEPEEKPNPEGSSEITADTEKTDLGFTKVYEAAQPAFDHAETVYRTIVAQILAD